MGCGYICFNCGRCRGVSKPLVAPGKCMSCGFENLAGAARCAKCGKSLPLPPGTPAKTSGQGHESDQTHDAGNPHPQAVGACQIEGKSPERSTERLA